MPRNRLIAWYWRNIPVRWIELGAVGTFDVGQLDQPLPVPEEAEVEGWVKTQLPGVTDVKFELEHWDAR